MNIFQKWLNKRRVHKWNNYFKKMRGDVDEDWLRKQILRLPYVQTVRTKSGINVKSAEIVLNDGKYFYGNLDDNISAMNEACSQYLEWLAKEWNIKDCDGVKIPKTDSDFEEDKS